MMSAKYTASSPTCRPVMFLEPFGLQHRSHQVVEEPDGDGEPEDVFPAHRLLRPCPTTSCSGSRRRRGLPSARERSRPSSNDPQGRTVRRRRVRPRKADRGLGIKGIRRRCRSRTSAGRVPPALVDSGVAHDHPPPECQQIPDETRDRGKPVEVRLRRRKGRPEDNAGQEQPKRGKKPRDTVVALILVLVHGRPPCTNEDLTTWEGKESARTPKDFRKTERGQNRQIASTAAVSWDLAVWSSKGRALPVTQSKRISGRRERLPHGLQVAPRVAS